MIKLPAVVWWILGLVAVAVVASVIGYSKGVENTQADWNASIERGKAEVERLKAEAGKITTVTEIKTEYKDRVIYEKGKDIVRTVEVFVPRDSNSCQLGGGFRLFHDASANNTIPDAAQTPNAAPTTATDVAATVSENYTQCNRTSAKLVSWQQWAIEQCALSKGCDDKQLRAWASGAEK